MVDEHKNWVQHQPKFNIKTWNLVAGCQELDRVTHRIGTNCVPQPSPGMEIQGIEIEFVTENT
jgi:hypothetical protein